MSLIPELKIGLLNAWLPILFLYASMMALPRIVNPRTIANSNYMTAPLNKAITNGMYKISRNPLYLFSGIVMIGISVAAASWIMLVIIALYSTFNHQIIKSEERYCLKTYGDEYREYMKNVPRYILFF